MLIQTWRLIIRDLKTEDEIPFVEMAADGSLNDIGFDKNCDSWMAEWIARTKKCSNRDDPDIDYLAYTITLRDGNIVIGSVGCSYYKDLQQTGIVYFIGSQYRKNGYAAEAVKAYVTYFFNHYDAQRLLATVKEKNISSRRVVEKSGFTLTEKKMYQDVNDEKEEMYYFYERIK